VPAAAAQDGDEQEGRDEERDAHVHVLTYG
jgi:hypothetical protein